MTFAFVHSAVDLGLAKGPRLAVVWHMAEGGGTVAFLSKPNPRGVSVHYVIEYTGRIVQMLDLTHMHSSLRTSDIRTTDDPDGFYGRSHALAVMGDWADISHGTPGPNHASIGVEMEGFAATGPNDKQTVAMASLFNLLRARWPKIRSLAHRDFQDYKPCPGRQVPWAVVGGHGSEVGIMGLRVKLDVTLPDGTPWNNLGTTKVAKAGALRRVADDSRVSVQVGQDLGQVQTGWFLGEAGQPPFATPTAIYALNVGNELHIIAASQCEPLEPLPQPAPPTADCTVYTDAMKEAGRVLAEALP